MSKTYVITGATDGIGAAVAQALFSRGDHVVALGTNPKKGEALIQSAVNAPGSVEFIQTDLSLVANSRRAINAILDSNPSIDGLVLCARYFRTYRATTAEGFEDNFSLFYLSRLLFSYGLLPALEKPAQSAIINVAGPGHDTPIAWDDLQGARNYDGVYAMFLSGRLNDLLGVSFAEEHGDSTVRYVLFHPGTTSTGFVGEFDPATAAHLERQKAVSKPATAVVPPIVGLLDNPPKTSLTAFNMYNELGVRGNLFSSRDAARLTEITNKILEKTNP